MWYSFKWRLGLGNGSALFSVWSGSWGQTASLPELELAIGSLKQITFFLSV